MERPIINIYQYSEDTKPEELRKKIEPFTEELKSTLIKIPMMLGKGDTMTERASRSTGIRC